MLLVKYHLKVVIYLITDSLQDSYIASHTRTDDINAYLTWAYLGSMRLELEAGNKGPMAFTPTKIRVDGAIQLSWEESLTR